ncbi:MAG TPA: RagB/SusD family nutrient uptake outer membrane protein [Balneolales bacterium]|nr:RagB/SusD family nutrient uptake outer membrane protein [Balneolales bacterium]
MKTYKILMVAITMLFALSSCQKFLTTQLTNQKTSDSYYRTPDDAATALVGVYNGLDLIWNGGPALPLVAEVASDNTFGGTGSGDGYGWEMMDEFNKSVSPTDASMFESDWQDYYQAIYRANTLIEKIGQVNWGNDAEARKTDEGEARFIRGYLYFGLARLFGHIPLITKPTSADVKQAPPDSVYAQIITDLKFAAANLPAKPYSATPSGRATKWAAESMLARVYLFYSGYYGKSTIAGFTKSDALAAVEDVIKNGGYSLVPNFASLWPAAAEADTVAYAGENNPEVVFSIKYTGNADYNGNITGNEWLLMTGIRLGGGSVSIYPYGYGWGCCTVDPKLWNAYSSNDTRRFATITSVQDEGLDTKTAQITGKPFSSANNREYTGYYLKKYSPLADTSNSPLPATNYLIAQKQDYIVMRYSDVLLMAAELGSPNAVQYFNEVHTRAGLASVSSVDEAAIMNERRLEFAGEGIRYWDLLRQGIQKAAQTIVANTSMSYLEDGTASPSISASNIIATGGFMQIPNNEITLSGGVLKQNPGW